MEHRVVAFSRSPEKGDMIRRLGADYIDGSDATALEAQRGAFDFILSTLNVPFDLDSYLRMLGPEGRFCFVATPLEPLSLRAGALYDYARRSIYGSYIGSRSDAVRMLAFAAEHDVLPEVEVMPFSQPNEAIGRVRRREMATALVLESLVGRGASE
jgi:D-arabinose 1-dehydrogenase-like Zn-dependent alcohol dehydrogenase